MTSLRDLSFLLSHAARAHAARGCPSFPLLLMTPLTPYTTALALRHVHTVPHLNSQVHFSTRPFHAHASSAPQLVGALLNMDERPKQLSESWGAAGPHQRSSEQKMLRRAITHR